MTDLELRQADDCRWDLVALGEVMLRLDPGDMRVATTRHFQASEGGGEYNVARGLARCFGLRTGLVTALADNPVGRLVEDLIRQGGVEQTHLDWVPYDGVGRDVRNGLNFTERGFGVRAALGCSDRGHTAISQLKPGQIDWDGIFGEQGARWFHCGGVFAALSETTAAVAREALQAARRHGTITSYDLNYRPSLWAAVGGPPRAAQVNRELIENVDVLLGNEEDLSVGLGYELEGVDENLTELDPEAYRQLLRVVLDRQPSLSIVATTLRQVKSASVNDWSAVCHTRSGFYRGPWMDNVAIFDRVGGGDSFASGFFYGLMTDTDIEKALAFGVAHGAIAMTTPGDTSMATLADVRRIVAGGAARVVR
jgi:2-dehydro-3-deoxygluconokinase